MTPSQRRSLIIGLVLGLVVVAVLIPIVLLRSGGGSDHVTRLSPPAPGETASIPTVKDVTGAALPADTFDKLSGGQARFSDYRGTPLVVNVWSTTCGPCVREMPDFESVHQAIGAKVTFIGLDHADALDPARDFVKRTGVTYDILRDPDGRFAQAMGVTLLPTTLFVDANGVVVKTKAGPTSASELTSLLQQLFPS
jgi:thiol-disulfide isomerase/thioredoxin